MRHHSARLPAAAALQPLIQRVSLYVSYRYDCDLDVGVVYMYCISLGVNFPCQTLFDYALHLHV